MKMNTTHSSYKRHRFAPLHLVGAVVLLLLLAGCSELAFQSNEPAYPRFSLTGEPQRDVTYDLTISGPGMSDITRSEIGPASGSVTIEIPAGRDRTFELLANNDVYSGITTTSLAPGSESTIRLPVLPGPVFVDMDADGTANGPRLVQVRDLSGVGQRSVPPASGSVEVDGVEQTSFSFQPIDAVYDSSGELWVVEQYYGYRFSLLGSETDPAVAEEVLPFPSDEVPYTAIALDSSNERVYVGNDSGAIRAYTFGGTEISNFQFVDSGTGVSYLNHIDGLSVGPDGFLYVVGQTTDGWMEVYKVDSSGSPVSGPFSPDESALVSSYSAIYRPPVADIHATEDGVYTVFSLPGLTETIWRLDLDDLTQSPESWGTRTTDGNPAEGEFWGPRRFVATRRENELIVIDQQYDDSTDNNLNGSGRLVRFEFDSTDSWQTFGEGESFGFFNTAS